MNWLDWFVTAVLMVLAIIQLYLYIKRYAETRKRMDYLNFKFEELKHKYQK